MAEQDTSRMEVKSAPKLILKSGMSSVNKKYSQDNTDIVFKNRETGQEEAAHKTVLSQLSPFFSTWFKEEWEQDKDRTGYPVPGDIEWGIFSNVISFLYGHQVEFEEDILLDLFKAADYLQLDNLKVAIIESMTDQWELEDPSIAGAMCTAVASQTDPRVMSRWLYTVSLRYLIRNIQMIVNNSTIDLSPLPYDVMVEIAQSEEIRVPEIQLYYFLRMWAECTHIKPSLEEVQSLFSHVRYATIPYQELEQIGKYPFNNTQKLWAAFTDFPKFFRGGVQNVDIVQLLNRKCQQGVMLLNNPNLKRWQRKVEKAPMPIYTIVTDDRRGAIVMLWPEDYAKESSGASHAVIKFSSLSQMDGPEEEIRAYVSYKSNVLSATGCIIQHTPTGIEVEVLHSKTRKRNYNVKFTGKYPWLITISKENLPDVTVQTL